MAIRDIIFHGKRIDNGEWVEGGIVQGVVHELWRNSDRAYITVFPEFLSKVKLEEVDPTTVGQYTGLTDKNGKKIFGGDIVKIDGYEKGYEVKYILGQFFVGIHMPIAYKRFDCEIIGNIHDNPEFLGDTDNGE